MFTWSALYNDDKILLQIDKDDTEHLFKEIEQEKLVRFGMANGKRHIVVDLTNGCFYIDSIPIRIPELSEKDEQYRLIYFRRVQKSIGTKSGMDDSKVESFIGFQVTIDGVNKQAMVSVVDADKISYNIHIK